jgi:hypothetical protein
LGLQFAILLLRLCLASLDRTGGSVMLESRLSVAGDRGVWASAANSSISNAPPAQAKYRPSGIFDDAHRLFPQSMNFDEEQLSKCIDLDQRAPFGEE